MKKMLMSLFLIMSVLLFCSTASAIVDSWMPANQVTIAWDAVTTLGDGSAITSGGTVEYEVVRASADKSDIQVLWSGPETQVQLTLVAYGRMIFGIKSLLIVDGQRVSESEYGWSDDPEVVGSAGTFGVLFYQAPAKVTGMTRQ